jgi:hypothetical protein
MLGVASGLFKIDVGDTGVVRAARRKHYVVDRFRKRFQKLLETGELTDIEHCCSNGSGFTRGIFDAAFVAPDNDYVGAFQPCLLRRSQADSCAAADREQRMSSEDWFCGSDGRTSKWLNVLDSSGNAANIGSSFARREMSPMRVGCIARSVTNRISSESRLFDP